MVKNFLENLEAKPSRKIAYTDEELVDEAVTDLADGIRSRASSQRRSFND